MRELTFRSTSYAAQTYSYEFIDLLGMAAPTFHAPNETDREVKSRRIT